ncbi:hypothetical protein [Kutzneria sp. 744]|uniref:hypothetical protein n=1 Tax=Kutzneria sp. (strain 744) TaxID=345341 RepID=UPI0012FB83E8|nr:hypothetical protein [Kutzneria sp. 744]
MLDRAAQLSVSVRLDDELDPDKRPGCARAHDLLVPVENKHVVIGFQHRTGTNQCGVDVDQLAGAFAPGLSWSRIRSVALVS